MRHFDVRIYLAHGVFWLSFAAGHFAARHRFGGTASGSLPRENTSSGTPLRAPRAKLLIGLHMVAFALLYTGMERAVFRVGIPAVPPLLSLAGGFLILVGGALMCWARLAFASWRFRAQIDLGHRLATGGPFRFIRHPIYAGLDLLAIGTALWIPTPLVCLGTLLMVVAICERAPKSYCLSARLAIRSASTGFGRDASSPGSINAAEPHSEPNSGG